MKPIKTFALLMLFSFVNLISFSQTGCPTISVNASPETVKEGDFATFTASVTGDGNFTYNWSVSAGTIESGQGTAYITVSTKGLANQSITATIELGGAPPSCPISSSSTIIVAGNPKAKIFASGDLADEKTLNEKIKAVIDELKLAENNTYSGSTVLIFFSQGSPKAKDSYIAAKKAAITKIFDKNQVLSLMYSLVTISGSSKKPGFQIWEMPKGAEEPEPMK